MTPSYIYIDTENLGVSADKKTVRIPLRARLGTKQDVSSGEGWIYGALVLPANKDFLEKLIGELHHAAEQLQKLGAKRKTE